MVAGDSPNFAAMAGPARIPLAVSSNEPPLGNAPFGYRPWRTPGDIICLSASDFEARTGIRAFTFLG